LLDPAAARNIVSGQSTFAIAVRDNAIVMRNQARAA
jgi:hypothetical protein